MRIWTSLNNILRFFHMQLFWITIFVSLHEFCMSSNQFFLLAFGRFLSVHSLHSRCVSDWKVWCSPSQTVWHHALNDMSWWRHEMETFSALLALCAGNSPVPVNSPHKGQWRGSLMFSSIYAWINDWVNNREAGDLRRQRGHYDVIVMCIQKQYETPIYDRPTMKTVLRVLQVNDNPMNAACFISIIQKVLKTGN